MTPTIRVGWAAVGLAVLTVAGAVSGHAQGVSLQPVAVPVVGTVALCPDIDGASVVAGSAGSGPGSLRAARLGGAYAVLPVTAAGQVAVVDRSAGAATVQAQGLIAAGLAVELRTRDLEGPVRGLSAMRCELATTSQWFVGGASRAGDSGQLVLANPDQSPALVDVTSWSATGPVERRPGRGLLVPARSRLVVKLDVLAPDRDLLTLHVQATRGRVAAAVRDARSDGRVARGLDWVPVSPAPAAEVTVAGLPAGPGRRTVVVTNPGQDDASVTLQLLTADGQVELDPLAVPAGTSVARDVSPQLSSSPASVRVRAASGLVLAAGLIQDLQDGPIRELAWAGAAAPLTGPTLLADVALSPPGEVTLLLSALAGDAAVELVPVPVVGQDGPLPAPRQVLVPGSTTMAVRLSTLLPAGSTARLAIELRPSGGPLVASRYLRERGSAGPLTAVLPVSSPLAVVLRPVVRADPLAGLLG